MRRYTQEEKSRWLQEWSTTNMSGLSFSRDKPFAASTLQYWKDKLDKEEEGSSSFIEVVAGGSSGKARFTFPSGAVLELDEMISIKDLKELLGC